MERPILELWEREAIRGGCKNTLLKLQHYRAQKEFTEELVRLFTPMLTTLAAAVIKIDQWKNKMQTRES